jgi:hypothetical protein
LDVGHKDVSYVRRLAQLAKLDLLILDDFALMRISLMADTDSTFIADSIPFDGGHPAQVS